MGRWLRRRLNQRTAVITLVGALALGLREHAWGYSVLTHEEIIDILWKDDLEPLLVKRYPTATTAELRKAQAYAYGGCLIQDLGYYPFGSTFFSELVHCVRSGDFVMNLIEGATNVNEYAFALGALAHYASDTCGHPAVNQVVAMSFPKLRAKYGDRVTYADDPQAHIRVEFGFDLVQVAKNRYTSKSYHDFIGFEVAKPLLERAFFQTYDVPLEDLIGHADLAIGTFRRGVSQVIPKMTQVAVTWKRLDLVKGIPNFSERKFRYYLSRSAYEREWGREYRRPSTLTRVLGFCVRLMPKIGPLKAMKFVIPTPQTEDLYIKSVDHTVEKYRALLRQVGTGDFKLANVDFDTGRPSQLGEYELSDWAYGELLEQLGKRGTEKISPELRQNIVEFYSKLDVPPPTKKQVKAWRQALLELKKIRAEPAGNATQKSALRNPKPATP